ncbi:hypothetical protein JXA56_03880 [Candidatus Micrarchaeota archaeon]|nr:hypothetical protein [Candidatus Micrarchaeota archaeon]
MRKIAIIMLMLLAFSYAENFVAVNSMDGRDVLSGIYYAGVKGYPVQFMTPNAVNEVFLAKVGKDKEILLIQSGNLPISTFIENELKKENTVELYASTEGGSTNLDLAKRSGAKSFIIVDSAFSDSAVSVLPYAQKTKSYVIFSNKENAAEVADAVSGAEKILIYGYVDQAVKDALASHSPQYVGRGEDKFEDNIAIVDKTIKEFGGGRVLFADGTYLEESMITANSPIILIGRLVPTVTYDYVKSKVISGEITNTLLMGQGQVTPVYDMRERMKSEFEKEGVNKTFGIIVKFAQVVPSENTGALLLDTFPLPSYKPSLAIGDVFYDTLEKKVYVSVDNVGEGVAFYTEEVRIQVDGEDHTILGDKQIKSIERGEQIPISYSFNIDSVPSGEVTALVILKYGSSKNSLEEFATKDTPLASIEYKDESNVVVQSAKYSNNLLSVTMRNNGSVDAYEFAKVEIILDGAPVKISAPGTKKIEAGSLLVEQFPLELSEEDIASNENVTVTIDYGARQGFLIKHAAFVVALAEESPAGLPIPLEYIVLAIAVIAIAAYFLTKKKPDAGTATKKPDKAAKKRK